MPLCCRLSSIVGTDIIHTDTLHTITLGLCQVRRSSMMRASTSKGLGEMRRLRVKEVAQEKGFTMARLQRAADINLKTIQAIWHNTRHDASFKTLDKIAKALAF